MGMPITVEVIEQEDTSAIIDQVYDWFQTVDERFSTYKDSSEISQLNKGLITIEQASDQMKLILNLAEKAKQDSKGYFEIKHKGRLDPSGIVKGWAINEAAKLIQEAQYKNFYIEAGGDIQVRGRNAKGQAWRVGIKNPFNFNQIVKTVNLTIQGIATSGTYLRGQHIYDPIGKREQINDIVSLTVIGPNILDADRFATGAFAMGKSGIYFIEQLPGFEGYMIDNYGIATETRGFKKYV
jgi:FAD:protein FMN transferase